MHGTKHANLLEPLQGLAVAYEALGRTADQQAVAVRITALESVRR